MWELDCEESWASKNLCLWTVVLEKTLESPFNCKEIKPVNPEGNQSWILIGRTDAEAETLATWCEELTGKDWCCERLTTGGEGDDRGWDGWMASPTRWAWVWASSGSWWWKGSLMCYSRWGHRVGHNWATEMNWKTAKMPALKTPVLHTEEARVYHPVLTFFSGSQFWMPVVITWEVKSV